MGVHYPDGCPLSGITPIRPTGRAGQNPQRSQRSARWHGLAPRLAPFVQAGCRAAHGTIRGRGGRPISIFTSVYGGVLFQSPAEHPVGRALHRRRAPGAAISAGAACGRRGCSCGSRRHPGPRCGGCSRGAPMPRHPGRAGVETVSRRTGSPRGSLWKATKNTVSPPPARRQSRRRL
jgi:hypothetical protein